MEESYKDIKSIEISSWTKRRDTDSSEVYFTYKIHVYMLSGIHWIIEKRFSEICSFRKEINKYNSELKKIKFPKKKWLFNFAESHLRERKDTLENYFKSILSLGAIIPDKIDDFLQVSNFLKEFKLSSNKGENLIRYSSGVREIVISKNVLIEDFQIVKVLGKGSFGKVFLVKMLGCTGSEVFAMKVLNKESVEKRNQVNK